MTSSKVEFAVQMSDAGSEMEIKKCLEAYGQVEVNADKGRVIVTTEHPWIKIQETIEKTGRKAVLAGLGDQSLSAVAIVDKGGERVRGVVRFAEANQENRKGCIVDGVLDGLDAGAHGIHIYECGDVSDGCRSVGGIYKVLVNIGQPAHENIIAADNGRAVFRFIAPDIEVSDLIGRSLVVSQADPSRDSSSPKKRLGCGIIARSAGIFENYKSICACDGVSIWDERNRPVAGAGRRNVTPPI